MHHCRDLARNEIISIPSNIPTLLLPSGEHQGNTVHGIPINVPFFSFVNGWHFVVVRLLMILRV